MSITYEVENKDLFQIIKKETMERFLNRKRSNVGQDLTKLTFNFMEIKEVLYSTLMDLEIAQVKERWGK